MSIGVETNLLPFSDPPANRHKKFEVSRMTCSGYNALEAYTKVEVSETTRSGDNHLGPRSTGIETNLLPFGDTQFLTQWQITQNEIIRTDKLIARE